MARRLDERSIAPRRHRVLQLGLGGQDTAPLSGLRKPLDPIRALAAPNPR